jgi:hypothetical protein
MATEFLGRKPAGHPRVADVHVQHNAIEATATGEAINVVGAKRIGIEFTEGGTVLNRSGVLTVTGSVDGGQNFRAFNMLIDNVSNTNAQNLTRVASKTRNAAGTDVLGLDMNIPLTHIKTVVTITDGATPTGNFTVNVLVEY